MKKVQEMVLYYHASDIGKKEAKQISMQAEEKVRIIKSVLVRMGVRIKNIGPDQVLEKVGCLAGIQGYETQADVPEEGYPYIGQEVLVMKNFTSRRIDVLLAALRKAGVPKIELKAVITPQNVDWSFYQLYQELLKEHREMESLGDD